MTLITPRWMGGPAPSRPTPTRRSLWHPGGEAVAGWYLPASLLSKDAVKEDGAPNDWTLLPK